MRPTRCPLTRAALSLLVPVTAGWVSLGPAAPASAAWSASGTGQAAAASTVMPTGASPTIGAVGTSVNVSWTTADLQSGPAVAGYMVHRFSTVTGSPATVGAGCSGIVSVTTCTELGVTAGSWYYTDTPVEVNWIGGQSPDSAAVTVP